MRKPYNANGNQTVKEPPPHNPQVEKAALGCITIDPRLVTELVDLVPPALIMAARERLDNPDLPGEPLFYSRANEAIFGAMVALAEAEKPFDLTVIAEELNRRSMLEAAGGAAYIAELQDDVLSLGMLPRYVEIIVDHWRRRYLVRQCEVISRSGIDGPISGALARLQSEVIDTLDKSTNGRLHLRDLDEVMAMEIDPHSNIVGDHLIELAEPTLIIGPPGIGKSRLVLQLACDILMGCEHWCQTIPISRSDVRIAMIQTENSGSRLKRELKRQLRGCDQEQRQAVFQGLRLMVPMGIEDRVPSLDDPAVENRLSRALAAFAPDIVIFDPLASFFSGESENDAIAMRQTIAGLQRVAWAGNPKAALVILHHSRSGRSAAAGAVGWDRGGYSRGSKALTGWARAQINVAPGSSEDGDVLVISCGKCSNGREFEPFAVRLDTESMLYRREEGFDFEEWETSVSSPRPKRGEGRKVATEQLVMIMREAGAVPESGVWIKKGVLADMISSSCGVTKRNAYRPINRALSEGAIMESGGSFQACTL